MALCGKLYIYWLHHEFEHTQPKLQVAQLRPYHFALHRKHRTALRTASTLIIICYLYPIFQGFYSGLYVPPSPQNNPLRGYVERGWVQGHPGSFTKADLNQVSLFLVQHTLPIAAHCLSRKNLLNIEFQHTIIPISFINLSYFVQYFIISST